MTDISNWPALIRKEGPYVMVPLNVYQMGNLIDALAQVKDNGDWWGELQNIVAAAMDVQGVKELHSNTGRTFTRDQIWNHDIRPKPTATP